MDAFQGLNCCNLLLFVPFGQAQAKLCFKKACHQDAIKRRKTHNCVGTENVLGEAAGGSKQIEQTLHSMQLMTITMDSNITYKKLPFDIET